MNKERMIEIQDILLNEHLHGYLPNVCNELLQNIYELNQEIDRLNNIINELEKYLEEESKYDDYKDVFYREHMGYVLNKLKELKGE